MATVYVYENCPLRTRAHMVADRSAAVRWIVGALWPAARRAERVVVSADGIEATTLVGSRRIAWSDVTSVTTRRGLLCGRVLRISAPAGQIAVAATLPGFNELEATVRSASGRSSAHAARPAFG